jgi:FkbM family methyltransferase
MGFWRRQQRSLRKRLVRRRYGDKPFIADYLGADFHVRLDNIMGREIAFRSFERDRIENFMALCEEMKPELFLDIGANCGVYACILLKAGLVPRAVLFEPDRENAAALRDNIKLNDLAARTALHEAAAGAKAGRATLIPGPAENKGQSRIGGGDGGYEVDIVVPDDIVPASGQTIAVKIDVEGFERDVLAGMARLLRDNRGLVQIESYDHERDVTAALNAAGYQLLTDMRPDFVFAKR